MSEMIDSTWNPTSLEDLQKKAVQNVKSRVSIVLDHEMVGKRLAVLA